MALVPLAEAQARVLAIGRPLESIRLRLDDALGHVLAEDVRSPEDVPPFANTAMDGFAVQAADTAVAAESAPVQLRVVATIAAGTDASAIAIEPGTAARIMTGAPMPPGADAVVMVERARTVAAGPDGMGELVEVDGPVAKGEHVREAGGDIAAGDIVFARHQALTPGHLGVLASIGRADVEVIRRPAVGVLSTGDELVDGGEPLRPGQIRDSNRRSLLALVRRAGFAAVDLGIVRDDEAAVENALRPEGCDALITTGGVSMGDFDYVKSVLQRLAPETATWLQVAIRPAKPISFAVVDDRPVFGLPGNPVSCMVSFELFARPALRQMAGFPADQLHRQAIAALAGDDMGRRSDGKTHFARVQVRYDAARRRQMAHPLTGQGSHMLRTMAMANALAVLPDGDGVAAGDDVDVLILD